MHRSGIIGAALSCALVLGGCAAEQPGGPPPPQSGSAEPGAEESAPPDGPSPSEDAARTGTDLDFAAQLRTHHQQVLELLSLAERNAPANPAVARFAAQVRPQRQAELAELEAWIAGPGEQSGSAPEDDDAPGDGGPAGTQGAHSPLPGELTPDRMEGLRRARGAEFDRGFKEFLTGLYDGAEQLAQTELDEGSAPPMRSLAERLLDRQDAERPQLDAL